jgi:hypothetical protein
MVFGICMQVEVHNEQGLVAAGNVSVGSLWQVRLRLACCSAWSLEQNLDADVACRRPPARPWTCHAKTAIDAAFAGNRAAECPSTRQGEAGAVALQAQGGCGRRRHP